MANKIKKTIDWLLMFLVFVLPWQTAYIFHEAMINGAKWQYGTFVLYATEILLWAVVLLQLFAIAKEKKFSIFNFQFSKNSPNFFISYFLFLIFIVWAGLSIIWSANNPLAFYYWFHLLEATVLFFSILKSKINWQKIYWAISLSAGVQAGLGIFQFLTQKISGSKWLGIASQSASDLGASVIQYDVYRWLRAYGGFSHPNILGGFLAIGFLVVLALYLHYSPGLKKILAAILTILIFTGLFFSFSRSAWLAAGVAGGLYLMITAFKQAQKRNDIIRISIYLLLVLVMLFLTYRPLVLTRLGGSERLEVKSIAERTQSLVGAEEIIKNNWLLGVGLGNYTNYLYQKNPALSGFSYQPAHNLYLMVLAELGVFGFLIFIFLIFILLVSAFKKWREQPISLALLLVIFILGLFDHYLWTSYFGVVFLFLIFALALKNNQSEND